MISFAITSKAQVTKTERKIWIHNCLGFFHQTTLSAEDNTTYFSRVAQDMEIRQKYFWSKTNSFTIFNIDSWNIKWTGAGVKKMEIAHTRPGGPTPRCTNTTHSFLAAHKRRENNTVLHVTVNFTVETTVCFYLRVSNLGYKDTGWRAGESRECTVAGDRSLPKSDPHPWFQRPWSLVPNRGPDPWFQTGTLIHESKQGPWSLVPKKGPDPSFQTGALIPDCSGDKMGEVLLKI